MGLEEVLRLFATANRIVPQVEDELQGAHNRQIPDYLQVDPDGVVVVRRHHHDLTRGIRSPPGRDANRR
jgi:hypothetical protein